MIWTDAGAPDWEPFWQKLLRELDRLVITPPPDAPKPNETSAPPP